jgi:hypothetical protein
LLAGRRTAVRVAEDHLDVGQGEPNALGTTNELQPIQI